MSQASVAFRTKFTPLEVKALNEIFENHKQYPNRQVMEATADLLDRPPLVIKNWFRNKRKSLHWRRTRRYHHQSSPSSSSLSPTTDQETPSPPPPASAKSNDVPDPPAFIKQEIQQPEEQEEIQQVEIIQPSSPFNSQFYADSLRIDQTYYLQHFFLNTYFPLTSASPVFFPISQ